MTKEQRKEIGNSRFEVQLDCWRKMKIKINLDRDIGSGNEKA